MCREKANSLAPSAKVYSTEKWSNWLPALFVASAAHALGRDGPLALGPAGHVDVVAVPVDEEPGRYPREAVGVLDLEGQLVGVLRPGRAIDRPVHAVDPQQVHVADLTVVDSLDHFLAGLRMAPHETDADLEVLLFGFFCGIQPAATRRCVGGKRFFGEDIHALADRVLEHQGPEGGMRGQQYDIVGPEAVDGLFVGVETNELTFGRDIDLVLVFTEPLQAALEPVLK